MSREQYKGIHDVINDQGFAMHYSEISSMVSHLASWLPLVSSPDNCVYVYLLGLKLLC